MPSTRNSEVPALAPPAPPAPAPAVDLATHRTELGILGPLQVVHRGAVAPIRGQRARALLARLALDAGRTVSVDGLVDALWGDVPPPTAVKMVHVYVSQLRKVLPGDLLRTRPPGYVLEVAPEAVDLLRFERLRGEARDALDGGDAVRGADLLSEALALWRGPALAEFSEPFAAAEATRIEELRLAAVEERIDADLALGRHADVVGELRALAAAHPLRQRPRGQLMLALYRTGRHAEALAGYRELRRALSDELGIQPPAGLRELELRILNQDPDLDVPAPPPAPALPASAPALRAAAPWPERGPAADGFVGRRDELLGLEAALGAAAAGRGAAALITGPAGIGKTRLVAELAQRARAGGATVLSGRCLDLVGADVPYLPIADALRPLAGTEAIDGLAELARLLPGGAAAAAACCSDRPTAECRRQLFDDVLTLLGRLAGAAPVVLVVEDLHWADASTIALLSFLAGVGAGRPLLVVATWRGEALGPDGAVARLTSGLERACESQVLELGPLAPDEVGTLLSRRGEAVVDPGVVQAVAARSEGNPFYAQELLTAALRGDDELPRVLRDVVLADFARLDPRTRSVLRVASAAGRDVHHRLLAAAMELAEREILEALRLAVDAGVLVPDRHGGTYRFRHALISEAVYATLLPGEREVVHERLATALAAQPAHLSGGAPAAELASHWIAARRPVEALSASLQAARDAEAVSGLAEALRHLERVLELWDHVPRAEELTGVALPAVLGWAAELVVPGRVGVTGARELYPLALMLESLAIRRSPRFDADAIRALRDANGRLEAAAGEPGEAVLADREFHERLVAGCGDDALLDALRPVKRALLRYEDVYMSDPACVARSVAQHDGIVAALERGDNRDAVQQLHRNITSGLSDLRQTLER